MLYMICAAKKNYTYFHLLKCCLHQQQNWTVLLKIPFLVHLFKIYVVVTFTPTPTPAGFTQWSILICCLW